MERRRFRPKKVAFTILSSLVILFSHTLFGGEKGAKLDNSKSTIVGDVIDVGCYFDKGLKGADHKQCALACAKKGMLLGILDTTGQLYIPILTKHATPPNPQLIPFLEERVVVTGRVVKRGGVTVVYMDTSDKKMR